MSLRVPAALAVSFLAPRIASACAGAADATGPTGCASWTWMGAAAAVGLLVGVLALLRAPRMTLGRSALVLVAPALGLLMVTSLITWGVGTRGCPTRGAASGTVAAQSGDLADQDDPCPLAAAQAAPCDCTGRTSHRAIAVGALLGIGTVMILRRRRRAQDDRPQQL